MNREWSLSTRLFTLILVVIFLVALLWAIREIFSPLIVAGLIAYMLNPAVNFLNEHTRINHKWAANLVYFIGLAILITVPVLVIPALVPQIRLLSTDLLDVLNQLQATIYQPVIVGGYVIHLESILPQPNESLAGVIMSLPENSLHFLESFSRNAAWLLVIIVTIYYLLMDWDHLREWLIRLAPETYRLDARRVYLEIKKVWAAYLRGQLALMFIVGVVFSLVWLVIGLPGAVILGIITGLFSLVPEIGPLAATLLALGVALIEGSNYLPLSNFWFGCLVLLIYLVLINFKNIWLRPRIMGRSVNMNEGLIFVAIIAAVMFSGVLGALIVVPVLASAAVVGHYLRSRILGLAPFSDDELEQIVIEDDPSFSQESVENGTE
jgi:predicted PurR-regulated permease PerM